jgi:hypothetical protein
MKIGTQDALLPNALVLMTGGNWAILFCDNGRFVRQDLLTGSSGTR